MSLEEERLSIAKIDAKIIAFIAKRQESARRIALIKHQEGLPVHDDAQVEEVLGRVFDEAVEHGVDPVSVQRIFEILIVMSEERQREFSGEGNLP
jgi:chorismate mutase